ncbi:MAG: UvrD-helicase domain-containing protein [Bacteroidales bacterium]|nr:UvrD-helicase domain-containing protein [Candidatus Hennigimonas equi]
MKASAGSGKTHTLAGRYIDMLMKSPDPKEYRHILAVTFTNKATDEMKERIIEDLYRLSREGSAQEREKADRILSDILHDYGSFAVSTIDRFFQQTLRAFARELGQFSRYQVELDKDALVDEAVDTILDELNSETEQDRRMVAFIVGNMEESLMEGGALNVDGALKEMGRQLKSEAFSRKSRSAGLDGETAYGEEELAGLKKACRGVMDSFRDKVRRSADDVVSAMEAAGLGHDDFSRRWTAFIEPFRKWDSRSGTKITDSVRSKIEFPSAETWFTKAKRSLFECADAALTLKLQAFAGLWASDDFRAYSTAVMLLGQIYGLGVAARLFKAFDRVAGERNVVCLDDSNSLLSKIIDGSDAPFVYEKTGVLFRTFLLDEFQDTSATQWDNFKPLLRESEAHKAPSPSHCFDNLIVGDVKQSIYRWRESDWGLLDHGVEEEFHDVNLDPLESNWRSLSEIVDFNNALYPALAKIVEEKTGHPDGMHSVEDIYSGCRQTLGRGREQQGGSVDVEFVQDEESQLSTILSTVNDLKDNHGAGYGDITVLVRKKSSGTVVAQSLIDNGIPVVTDASLRIKNSISVRRLVSMMSYVDNPEDEIGGYIAAKYGISVLPSAWHSLPDLAEALYKQLCLDPVCKEDCAKEVMYITSFMDFVMDYSVSAGNNLREFLKYWQEKDPDVNTARSDDAVHIITIHKSKGLAAPYVIVPFLEKITLYEPTKTRVWSLPQKSGGVLDRYSDKLYYVPLNDAAADSYFSDSYSLECFNQGVDAVNLLYVATTRARYGMKLIANVGGRNNSDNNMAGLLYSHFGLADYHSGEMSDFSALHRDSGEGDCVIDMSFPCYDIEERLEIRPYAADFFTEADKEYGSLSYRERGIVLHDILGRVRVPSDLGHSVDVAVSDGSLAAGSRGKVMDFLGRCIASHPEFFPEDDEVKVLMEQTVFGPDGSEHRPDRVLVRPDGRVVIVDYKFGSPHEEYSGQIERYKTLFSAMGYKRTEAHLWFVYQNKIL